MGFLKFGKRIKNRQFDYIPRYYDPDKEELENRIKQYKRDPEDTELTKERIRGGLRRKYRVGNEYTKASNKRSNLILFGTLVVLLLLTFVFISEYLPKIIATFD